MQRVKPSRVAFAVISSVLLLPASGIAAESMFVFIPEADAFGGDYLRADAISLEQCERSCDAQVACRAFTYNQLHKVCFLKRSANRTSFYAYAITGIKVSPSVQSTAGAPGSGASFLMLSQTDSPGNDYSRIEHLTFEECQNSCREDEGCNAFTYNHAHGVCFLKSAANEWTTFYAWATTGIKLAQAVINLPTNFAGVWIGAGAENNKCQKSDWETNRSDGLINVQERAVDMWESGCKVLSVTEPEDSAQHDTIEVNLDCGGEGMTWRSREVWHLQLIEGRKALIMTTLSTSDLRDDSGKKMPSEEDGARVSVFLQCP